MSVGECEEVAGTGSTEISWQVAPEGEIACVFTASLLPPIGDLEAASERTSCP